MCTDQTQVKHFLNKDKLINLRCRKSSQLFSQRDINYFTDFCIFLLYWPVSVPQLS